MRRGRHPAGNSSEPGRFSAGKLQIFNPSHVGWKKGGIFNKYKLNQTIYAYAKEKSDCLWETIAASFSGELSETDKKAFRIIADGSFEKLCEDCTALKDVMERPVKLL